ncbi:hypothetical protein ACN9KI_04025 [Aliarcobacter butzleri]|uniref:hypothetical protein n=1 Tax=Aliarcobacter butzleri TaxID=28197 RepID=UPI003B2222F0
MGKVEILTLIAGVVLSISLALIVVPIFGKSEDIANSYKLKSELITIRNVIDMSNKLYNNDILDTKVLKNRFLKIANENFKLKIFVRSGYSTNAIQSPNFENIFYDFIIDNLGYLNVSIYVKNNDNKTIKMLESINAWGPNAYKNQDMKKICSKTFSHNSWTSCGFNHKYNI